MNGFPLAQRMSWASTRAATRVEDTAYSLLGIFDIAMPVMSTERPTPNAPTPHSLAGLDKAVIYLRDTDLSLNLYITTACILFIL